MIFHTLYPPLRGRLSRLEKTQMLLSSILWIYNDRQRLSISITRVMSILLLAQDPLTKSIA